VTAVTFGTSPHPAPASPAERERILSAPRFGESFSDHMALVDWTRDRGWFDPRVVPLGPIPAHPATGVLHYAQQVFEGLKVYRHPDGSLHAFRPELNARRLRRSARRLALPELPEDLFLASVDALVGADAAWVPGTPGHSLYLRPFVMASETFLGVRATDEARYCVIASPAGSYFPGAGDGVSLWLSTTYSRAGRGGTGAAKCGGNYASSLAAQQEACERGCDQALFTDAATSGWVEEAGSMNIFFAFADGTLVTPPANGTILEGVTRASVLELAADLGHPVDERPISVREWADAAEAGDLVEVFATGTAAVITPIARLVGADVLVTTPVTGLGPVAARLHRELTGIQYGTMPDRFGWMRPVAPGTGGRPRLSARQEITRSE
jgi:branched-chain amino acid aminotransferase